VVKVVRKSASNHTKKESPASAEKTLVNPLTRRWNPQWKTHEVQNALKRTQVRFVAVPAGRRSGKTEFAKIRLVAALRVKRPWFHTRYFFGGPTYEQAKRIAWQDLLDLIPDHWVPGGKGKGSPNVSHSELWIRAFPYPDGRTSTLHVVGLDNPARVEGTPWDGCVLDESCDLHPTVFDRSIRPALADRGGWCWRIGVPKRMGQGASNYREFCEACAAGTYPDGACFTWSAEDILPEAEIAHARATLPPKDYAEQYQAKWETASGQIFYAFDKKYNVRPCGYDGTRALVVGSDFNVDPMAWVIGQRYENPNRMEWFDELWLRDANTEMALDVLWSRYEAHKGGWEFYGDATSKARKTSTAHKAAVAQTDYFQIANDPRFKKAGRSVHYPSANPNVASRLSACNAMFKTADGNRRMFVDPDCKRLIRDLEMRAYKPGTREPADSGDTGHITDAMGYPVRALFPVTLDLAEEEEVVYSTIPEAYRGSSMGGVDRASRALGIVSGMGN